VPDFLRWVKTVIVCLILQRGYPALYCSKVGILSNVVAQTNVVVKVGELFLLIKYLVGLTELGK
jgi:hypothetical protein